MSLDGRLPVNDVHSRLNPTLVHRIVPVDSVEAVRTAVQRARFEGRAVCVAGGRHAMGAQQFGSGAVLLDTSRLNRVLDFDAVRGTVEVEAGILWPELIRQLLERQQVWGIAQKQTGADRLSLGGAVAANVHGRGLTLKPIVGDIESFKLVNANGNLLHCSRRENAELFRLAIGGYGLFGVVYSLTLRLVPRRKLRREVRIVAIDDLMAGFDRRIRQGALYGDFQFCCDESSPDFLQKGVFSCYLPVDPALPVPDDPLHLSPSGWKSLIHLAHADKAEAFRRYVDHYLSTAGQIYWSDTHQLSLYFDGYHEELERKLGSTHRGSEMITELYIPRQRLRALMSDARDDFRRNNVNVIYGTVRLIGQDDESFLAWAREPWACIVFNLHVDHTPRGIRHASAAFRRLIDLAIRHGGSYYLTYHKFATREQVEACYPKFREFLGRKRRYDPEERFQSDWYVHYRDQFLSEVSADLVARQDVAGEGFVRTVVE